jgi:hypothetical protein
MRLPRSAVAAMLAAGIIVPAVSGAAVAMAAPSSHSAGTFVDAAKSDKPGKPGKPSRRVKVKFAAEGRVTAVDAAAGTVTLLAKSGTKDVRKKTITVAVPAGARIVVGGRRATVAGIVAGARIAVTGTRVGAEYTAARISATRPKPAPSKKPVPVVTPSPSPSVTPDPTASAEPGDDDTDPGDEVDPTDDPQDDL